MESTDEDPTDATTYDVSTRASEPVQRGMMRSVCVCVCVCVCELCADRIRFIFVCWFFSWPCHLWSLSTVTCTQCSIPHFMSVCVCSPPVTGCLPEPREYAPRLIHNLLLYPLCTGGAAHDTSNCLSLSSGVDRCYALWTAPSELIAIATVMTVPCRKAPSHMTMSPSLFLMA